MLAPGGLLGGTVRLAWRIGDLVAGGRLLVWKLILGVWPTLSSWRLQLQADGSEPCVAMYCGPVNPGFVEKADELHPDNCLEASRFCADGAWM